MSNNLMGFILRTLQTPLNDPENQNFWLPRQLVELKDDGRPVLPIQADSENIGQLKGSNGTTLANQIAEKWSIVKQQTAVPNPDDRYPYLDLSDLSIEGLENAYLSSVSAEIVKDPKQGIVYEVVLLIAFNHYQGHVGALDLGTLKLSTNFKLSQSLSISGTDETPEVTGNGSFTAEVTTAYVEAGIHVLVKGTGSDRSLAFDIRSIVLRGKNTGEPAVINVPSITIKGENLEGLEALIQQALNDPQGQKIMAGTIQSLLNTEKNLSDISNVLSKNSSDVLNKVFGDLPASGLPKDDSGQTPATPADLFFFDRMRAAVGDPKSNWYLPHQISASKDPILEPYSAKSLNVPNQKVKGLEYTEITLSELSLTGLSNIAAPLGKIVLTTPEIDVLLQFSTLPAGPDKKIPGYPEPVAVPPAPPMALKSNFTFTQNGFRKVVVKGALDLTISGISATATTTPSGTQANDLELAISGLNIDHQNAKFGPSITLDPPNPSLAKIAEEIFAMSKVQDAIGKFLNDKLSGEQCSLSKQFTTVARSAIQAQLGET